jgi:hypothetical protein
MNTPTFNNNNYNNNNNNNNKKTQERFLILRAIRYKNKFMAIIIINSYDIKNQIESMFAKPATTFVRYDQYKSIIDNDNIEKTKFKEMCYKNFENEDETDNLYFLTSLKDNEISQMKLKQNFQGFQLITSLGLHNITFDKYNRDCLNYDKELNSPINVNMLDEEINETAEKIHSFLKNYCAITKTTPIQSQYTNYYYTLIKQRRNLNDNGVEKFQKLLNLGYKIHRFNPMINNTSIENNETL